MAASAVASLSTAALAQLIIAAILVSLVSSQTTLEGECEPDATSDESAIFVQLGSSATEVSSATENLFNVAVEVKTNDQIVGLRVFFAYEDADGMESTDGVNIVCKCLVLGV